MSNTNDGTASVSGQFRRRAERVFSPRKFLLSLAVCGAGFLAAGAIIPLGSLVGLVGVFAGAFGFGLLRRGYVETTLAGASVAGIGTLLDYLVISVLGGVGVPVAILGVGAGATAGLVGHYFGRDLRDGLTREI